MEGVEGFCSPSFNLGVTEKMVRACGRRRRTDLAIVGIRCICVQGGDETISWIASEVTRNERSGLRKNAARLMHHRMKAWLFRWCHHLFRYSSRTQSDHVHELATLD